MSKEKRKEKTKKEQKEGTKKKKNIARDQKQKGQPKWPR